MNQIALCKLCGTKAKLLRRSHIIPTFMFKELRDELNRMIYADLNSSKKSDRYEQSAYYEKYILCSKCDNVRINKWEKYVNIFLFGGNERYIHDFKHAVGPNGVKSIIVKNIDYKKLKLFLLSLVWRSHISTNKFFQRINVKENAEKLRLLLLEENQLLENEFKVAIVALKPNNESVRMVLNPRIIKVGSGEVVAFFINGLFYFIDLIPNSSFRLFDNHYLIESDTYEIMLLDGEMGAKFMSAFGLPDYIVKYYFGNI